MKFSVNFRPRMLNVILEIRILVSVHTVLRCQMVNLYNNSLEDFDVEEEDEEALIEQRRLQRQAIVQVCYIANSIQTRLKF